MHCFAIVPDTSLTYQWVSLTTTARSPDLDSGFAHDSDAALDGFRSQQLGAARAAFLGRFREDGVTV